MMILEVCAGRGTKSDSILYYGRSMGGSAVWGEVDAGLIIFLMAYAHTMFPRYLKSFADGRTMCFLPVPHPNLGGC